MRLRQIGAAVLVCALALAGSAAQARKASHHTRHESRSGAACVYGNTAVVVCPGGEARASGHAKGSAGHASNGRVNPGHDPRPAAWCGWWLRHELGVADRLYNLARAWALYGQPAHGPDIGVVVVWRHHVGIITGRTDGQWIVKSGNDGHAVRERPRSLAGVIAFRRPNGMAMR